MQTLELRSPARLRTRWIRRPAWDAAMALSWVPFAALAVFWTGNTSRLEWLVGATLIFSVSHQPLTMPLVYADPHVMNSRPRVFRLTPFVFVGLVLIGPLGRAVRSRSGPLGLMVMYTVGVAALIWAIRSFGIYDVYAFTFLTLGALHLFYDGLIWKLRRPEVARGFQIPSGP